MISYKDITIDYIINYCKENNQVEWLKAKAKETTIQERYTGKVRGKNKAGKECWLVDKNSPKEKVKAPITFIEIKKAFCEKFMPEIIPQAKDKAPSMYDRIAAL
jgi:hypothetical protein